MKKINIFLLLLLLPAILFAQEIKPVKNVIVMIPDGTTLGVYSAARWFKHYNKMGERLQVDPYLTGTVTTHSSNAPIGDSAPAGSAYATGVLQQPGNVAIHPQVSENDIFAVDGARTWQPAATILEAMKIEKQKAVGLVVTCEFPHATPADFSAHHYKRSNYKALAPQMAYQNLDVMFGGGNGILTDDIRQHFNQNGTTLFSNDRNALLNYQGEGKVWALFGDGAMTYDLDRNPEKAPSLAEMTDKALQLLSKKENGFFLMVEGSHVDWAAHANDAAAVIHEFLAFDEAVGKVMDFAQNDGNTAVVILSDHATGGLSIGSRNCSGSSSLSLEDLFGTVSNYKISASGLESILVNTKPDEIKSVFKEYTDVEITDEEMQTLLSSKNYKEGDYTQVGTSENLAHNIVKILNARTCFGFTTGSHTGEEVLLASYHPQGDILKGNVTNRGVNEYLQKVAGLEISLQDLSDSIFAKHQDVFASMNYSIDKQDPDFPVLKVKKGRNTLEIKAFSSVAKLNGKSFDLGSVIVYIDKNDTFYLPVHLKEKL
ncbi:MAG: alkaline phosphatase [Proteiniphilum sp.]|jgi:alkaline phosphatase|nr:alkaline phosphatase [Proteiniphilum sp.]NCB25448.1 alkaline phosphatase [Bacteroidia bacterium]MDD2937739.1 alkaline phosphatase [Proteiniphilum sp.]MDD3075897.1 alkaline phosphatase [Proteiniphilum sp.]MDD3778780.1 alkaline phosphatase [Proteiniphilum sp.]